MVDLDDFNEHVDQVVPFADDSIANGELDIMRSIPMIYKGNDTEAAQTVLHGVELIEHNIPHNLRTANAHDANSELTGVLWRARSLAAVLAAGSSASPDATALKTLVYAGDDVLQSWETHKATELDRHGHFYSLVREILVPVTGRSRLLDAPLPASTITEPWILQLDDALSRTILRSNA